MDPALKVLSLGAGVQSTAILLLAAEGRIKLDACIFADTGWEPEQVYNHLNRLDDEVAKPAGIPIHRVSAGNIRDDALGLGERFASMPLYIANPNGTDGMLPRQCTADYKVAPIKRKVRDLLGYPAPQRVPKGMYVLQSIGISMDEAHRARDSDVGYVKHTFPLLDMHWDRKDCIRYLERSGWGSTPKSACIGCPFHGNRAWRTLRDENPTEWQNAVDFDAALRAAGSVYHSGDKAIDGDAYLHRARIPLSEVNVDRKTRAELKDDQIDIFDAIKDVEYELAEEPELSGCSPFACRSDEIDLDEITINRDAVIAHGLAVDPDFDLDDADV